MALGGAWTSTGGLRYHVRAWRYGSTLWQPHRHSVERWLAHALPLDPERARLLLIGPSAGYSLSDAWLSRLHQVWWVEPDPLARLLFAHRLRRLGVRSQAVTSLSQLARLRPAVTTDVPVLFANVLGQLAFAARSARAAERLRRQLAVCVEGRAWASYHDRWSGPGGHRSGPADARLGSGPQWLSGEYQQVEPAERAAYEVSDDRLLERFGECFKSGAEKPTELGAHDALSWLPASSRYRLAPARAYWTWELTPGWRHLIEGVSTTPVDLGQAVGVSLGRNN